LLSAHVVLVAADPDTIVRLVTNARTEQPTWLIVLISTLSAVLAGSVAQWFRVRLDLNRRREQLRQVLLMEVAMVQMYLERMIAWAEAWQLPTSGGFWVEMDNAMRGYDAMHTELVVLPHVIRVHATAWFASVKGLRLAAAQVAQDYRHDEADVQPGSPKHRKFEKRFDWVLRRARADHEDCDLLYRELYDAVPGWFERVGSGFGQPYASLAAAREAGARLGLLPKGAASA
jgi:hypothetical protein